jgi:hypothetical protein
MTNKEKLNIGGGIQSAWRGGIGLVCYAAPAKKIPDITELGYELIWGEEDPACAKMLEIAMFRYWGCGININLKNPPLYDFSQMADKEAAARLAFEAYAEHTYGVKGLAQYVQVKYEPANCYGDVCGAMDLASDNPLVHAIINSYLKGLKASGIKRGGIALDGGGTLPQYFLSELQKGLNAQGYGVASNGSPDRILPYLDLAGDEVFPYRLPYVRAKRKEGCRAAFAEYTTQHFSPGELAAYLKAKLLNGIVFVGYTAGGIAAGNRHSRYYHRPDVYNHHRWVLRKYVSLSRAIVKAGLQAEPHACLKSYKPKDAPAGENIYRNINADGNVVEFDLDGTYDINHVLEVARGGEKDVVRYGCDIKDGIYLYVNSDAAEDVSCDIEKLAIGTTTVLFDEFNEQVISGKRVKSALEFTVPAAPALIQLGSRETIAKNILSRIVETFRQQALQRNMDQEIKSERPLKPWAHFCQGWTLDNTTARSGGASLKLVGGTFASDNSVYTYSNRQGAAQFVSLDQERPAGIILTAYSKCENIPKSDLETIDDRHADFRCREAYAYRMHLYVDYQDGNWPEMRAVRFSPGTHDWEKRTIEFMPEKPVKTVMVLLEIHQPEGTAWFDDISLTQADEPDKNLLDYPGFEIDGAMVGATAALNNEYESKLRRFLDLLAKARAEVTAANLRALQKEAEAAAKWLKNIKYGHDLGREARDFDEAVGKISLCLKIPHA